MDEDGTELSNWEEIIDDLRDMVSSLAEVCGRLTRVSFCSMMPKSTKTLEIVSGGDEFEIVPLGHFTDIFTQSMYTSGHSDMYGGL